MNQQEIMQLMAEVTKYLKEVRELKAAVNKATSMAIETADFTSKNIKILNEKMQELIALNPEAAKDIIKGFDLRLREVEQARNPITFEGRFTDIERWVADLKPAINWMKTMLEKAVKDSAVFKLITEDDVADVKIIRRNEYTNEEILDAYKNSGLGLQYIAKKMGCSEMHAHRMTRGEVKDIVTRAKLMVILTNNDIFNNG